MKYFDYNIDTIGIILTRKCNLNCGLCVQKQYKTANINYDKSINLDIFEFIKQYYNKNKNLNILFYGGEPLLYFDKIKEVVLKLEENKVFPLYKIVTNCSLLNKEMVEFFNKYKFQLNISWDGNGSLFTRGYNILDNINNILKLKIPYYVNSVITNKSYPKELCESLQEFSDKYYKPIFNKELQTYIINIQLNSNNDKKILYNNLLIDFDLERLKNEMKELVDIYFKNPSKNSIINNFIHYNICRMYDYFDFNKDSRWETKFCHESVSVLKIDLLGNLYLCSDIDNNILTIYDDYPKLINNIACLNKIRKDCKNCEVISFCNGICRLASEKVKNIYCEYTKALYIPIYNKIIEMSKNGGKYEE